MAATTLNVFIRAMKDRAEQVRKNVDKAVRSVALAADQQIVTATPVDTGRARSNWIASVDSPVTLTREPYVLGSGGTSGGANAQAAIDQARSVIAASAPGKDIWISNNLPYIDRLNKGHSAQASANFVETGIRAGIEELKRVKVLEG